MARRRPRLFAVLGIRAEGAGCQKHGLEIHPDIVRQAGPRLESSLD